MDIAQRLIDFAEAGNQQKIILANGQVLQGWIMEITDEALLISTGFSDKVGKDCWIKLSDLTQAQLSYWDNRNDVWQPFIL
ncbi:hypothetical protein [Acinetobacter populi]|jgi:hypothetical protein|uniref:Uncharacterized protein n=1 Tax=Acinetobacter populi TaxID=1582270 RepID=A0A1Z9Z3B7_9GAMM|nr:hypothetical protein [Acinetobacter populi]MCH4246721.1 hypothetical protein [Acinetobacter populi]OUY08940.1 hypothetical protein CAP51_04825 [Acinetobacter populi]